MTSLPVSPGPATEKRTSMHFAYEGFTHNGARRSFLFRGVEELNPPCVFSIEIDLSLLALNRVSVQEGPMFCLQLLTTASLDGPSFLEKLHHYIVVGDDFRPLLVERERRAALKALQRIPRKPARKPAVASQFRGLGKPIQEH